MCIIEKLEKGNYNLSEFTTDQINFIMGLVKIAKFEGYEEGREEVKNKLWKLIDDSDD